MRIFSFTCSALSVMFTVEGAQDTVHYIHSSIFKHLAPFWDHVAWLCIHTIHLDILAMNFIKAIVFSPQKSYLLDDYKLESNITECYIIMSIIQNNWSKAVSDNKFILIINYTVFLLLRNPRLSWSLEALWTQLEVIFLIINALFNGLSPSQCVGVETTCTHHYLYQHLFVMVAEPSE